MLKWLFGKGRRETRVNPERVTWNDLFGTDDTKSDDPGAAIKTNPLSALKYPAVWRAVSMLSNDIAKLPLHIWQDRQDDNEMRRELAKRQPAYRLLRYRPNMDMGSFQFRQAQMVLALLAGNHYSFIQRNENGDPTAIIPICHGANTYPVRDEKSGMLFYATTNTSGKYTLLKQNEVLHVKGLGSDGITGLPFNCYAADSLGLGLTEQRYTTLFFEQGGTPPIVLKGPRNITKEQIQMIKTAWQDLHSGLKNKHKAAVIQGDMELIQLKNGSAQDAQLVEGRGFEIKQVANWFGVPAHMLNADGAVAYNSLEQETQHYLSHALDPWLVAYEEECNRKLIPESKWLSGSLWCEFDRTKILRADSAARANYYQSGIINGWLNRDEVREQEGLNPIPDGAGQKFLLPVQGQTDEGGEE